MVPEVQVIEIDVYVLKYVYFQSAPMGHTDFSVNMLVETVKWGTMQLREWELFKWL